MSRESPSIAKISRPKLARVYPRRRLFRLLDRSRGRPVIWISAPAGSGKTTLVNSWLDSQKFPCLWYQVDEGDADIASFFYYLGLAGKKAAPRIKRPLPLLTREYSLGIPAFTRRYFENLCSRLRPPFVLVFDNYQTAPQNSQFHDIMSAGLSSLPEGIVATVVSRADPPPPLTTFIANNNVSVIGWEDMRLTPEESQGIARMESGESLSTEVIDKMHERAQGWAAGLILLSQGAKAEGAAPESAAFDPVKVFDYFASELFDRAGEAVQGFLFKTSFLPKITVSTAERITGNHHAARILADLNRGNYFTERKQGREIVYQYHPLFREFLQNRARNEYPPAEIAALQRAAGGMLEEAGRIEEAASLFLEAADQEGTIRLVLRHGSTLVSQGRSKTLEGWLNTLSREVVDESPWLLFWLGCCRVVVNPYEGRDLLIRAYDLFKKAGDLAGTLQAWANIADTIFFGWGEKRDRWIREFDEILAAHPKLPSPQLEARTTVSMFWLLALWTTLRDDLGKWEKKVSDLAYQCPQPVLKMQMNHQLLLYNTWIGDFAKVGAILHSLGQPESAPDDAPLAHLLRYDMNAQYAWVLADHKACLDAVREGLQLAERTGVHLLDPYLFMYGVSMAVSIGEQAVAGELLQRMAARPLVNPMTKSFFHILRARVEWKTGNSSSAVNDAAIALELVGDLDSRIGPFFCRAMMALACNDDGQREEALRHLAKMREVAEGANYLTYITDLIGAGFALARGSGNECDAMLGRAMAIGARQGYLNFPWWQPDVMAGLCVRALEQGIEPEYVRTLIRTRNLVPDKPPLRIENWPWQVNISTLGDFALEVDEKTVTFSGKVQKKPLEILKTLVALGGRDVGAEQIAEALWPDSDGDKALHAFESALHRLRKIVANDRVIEVKDGRVSLDPRYCLVDVWAFEKILLDAETAGTGHREKEDLLEKAISLYKGHFLPADAREHWTMSMRERLRSKYLRLVAHLGEQRMESRQHQSAIDLLQKGLEIDDLAEEFYQQLMLCYKSLGQEAEAVKVYYRCRAALSGSLGIEPSSRTEEIFSSLRLKK